MAREYNHPSSQTTFYNNDNYLGHHAYHQRVPYHQDIQIHQHYQPSEYYASYMTTANHAHHTNYTHPKPQISRGATRRPQQSPSPIQTQNQIQTVHTSNNQIIYAQDMQPYTYSMTPKTSKPEIKHNRNNDTFYAQDIVQSPYSNPYSLSTSTTTTPQNEMSPVIDTTMYAQDTVQYPQTSTNVNHNIMHVNNAGHEQNHGINASHTHHQHVHTQAHIHHTQPHIHHTQPTPILHTQQPQTQSRSQIHTHTHAHTNQYASNSYHHATIHNRSHPNRDTHKHVPKHEEYKYEEPRIPVPPKRDYDIYYKPIDAVNKDKQTLTKKDHHIFCGIQQADLYQTLWEHYHKNIELFLKVQSFVEEGGYYAANMKELRETMIIEQMMNKEQFQDFIENDYSNFINGQTVYINSIEIKKPKNGRVQALTKGIERIVNLKSVTMRVINDIDKMLTRLDDVMTDHANENDKITNYALQFTTKI